MNATITQDMITTATPGKINAYCDCGTFGPVGPDFTCAACETIALVEARNWTAAREVVLEAARAGRVYYDAADKHNGGVARVQIDDREVGQASSLVFFRYTTTTGRRSGVVTVL